MTVQTVRGGLFPAGNSGQGGLIARSSGTQANSTALPAVVNRVETVAVAADGVLLPTAVPGTIVCVVNATANAIQVFGQASNDLLQTQVAGGDSIAVAANSTQVSGATGVSQAGHAAALYVCAKAGEWKQCLMVT